MQKQLYQTDAIWEADLCGSNEPCTRWGPDSPWEGAFNWGFRLGPIWMSAILDEITTVGVWQQCGSLSIPNYSRHYPVKNSSGCYQLCNLYNATNLIVFTTDFRNQKSVLMKTSGQKSKH